MGWDKRPLAIFLMGPTAVGKTELACELREHFPCELVSVDSALVYRGLNIGAAKPEPALLERHPHALIDIRDPVEPYSAADFQRDAMAAMQAISARGRVPLLVGGTGLYFRALQRGLSPLPSADPVLRQRLVAEAERIGWAVLHQRLAARDPQAAARIRSGDAQRIQRALEVIELSGQSLSTMQGVVMPRFPWRVLKLGLWPRDRAGLHQRIALRFQHMLEQGLLEEVAALRERGDLVPELPAIRAVGYRQAWEWLEQGGRDGLGSLHERGVAATRQLAKRQLTWLRSEWDLIPLPAEAADRFAQTRQRVVDFLASVPLAKR